MISKILIVEDEAIQAMTFIKFLESSGYAVMDVVSTGKDAIKKAADKKPNLILMDIELKGEMDGIEAATVIKENNNIPIIFLTVHSKENIVKRAKLTSPHDYISKFSYKEHIKNIIELKLHQHHLINN